jgi:hypothetical protein
VHHFLIIDLVYNIRGHKFQKVDLTSYFIKDGPRTSLKRVI